ncbi:MAG: dienelactone hydrolase family protein [Acidimicrobiales bacterium]|nr:dienelactone hydrolase family protein [Acidimicrobiales bacterium]
MIEEQVDLTTADGTMTTFVVRPEHDGPHPVVLYLMDAPSIRPALMDMASRLATAGYYVMVPYLYYRVGPFQRWDQDDSFMHKRLDLMASIDPTRIVIDAEAMLAHAASDPAAADGPVGAVGFCMSGGLTLAVAKAFPDRVRAAASIHGAFLVRDGKDDSPHLDLDRMKAEVHFAWCATDELAPPEHRELMARLLDEASVTYTIDVEPTAQHGFAPAGPRYDREASERHWERVHSLLRRRL